MVSTLSKRRQRSDCKKETSRKKPRAPRSVKRHKLIVRDSDGFLREIRPTDTLWYLLYVGHPPLTERIYKKIRQRFRLPYESFIQLSDEIFQSSLIPTVDNM